jgi:hypothetical protein
MRKQICLLLMVLVVVGTARAQNYTIQTRGGTIVTLETAPDLLSLRLADSYLASERGGK